MYPVYKSLSKGNWSLNRNLFPDCAIHYDLENINVPKIKGSLIFVFKDLIDLKRDVDTQTCADSIWLCDSSEEPVTIAISKGLGRDVPKNLHEMQERWRNSGGFVGVPLEQMDSYDKRRAIYGVPNIRFVKLLASGNEITEFCLSRTPTVLAR